MMQLQKLLIFCIISVLFFGSVLSDSTSTSSTPAFPNIPVTTPVPNSGPNDSTFVAICLNGSKNGLLFKRIIQNETLLKKFMNQGLNESNGNGQNFIKNLQKNDNFTSKFVDQLMGDRNARESLTENLVNEYPSEMIQKILNDETAKNEVDAKVMGDISADSLANLVFEKRDSIKAIAKNDTQINAFLEAHEFRGAAIHKILKNYPDELKKDAEYGLAIKKATHEYLKNSSTEAMHIFLKENPDYTLILKLLILSPMIFAWISSLLCIAIMCGVCYPFGLSESTKSKSKEKKGRKSTDEKKGKKKSGNDEYY